MEPLVSAVVPSFRGAGHLGALFSKLLPILEQLNGELVLVDDCSDDDTWKVMTKAASENKTVTCVRLDRRSGQQTAVLAGCKVAGGRWIVTLDDDLEHDPVHIAKLLSRGEEGFDLVYAVPGKHAMPVGFNEYIRRIGSMFFGFAFSVFIGKPLRLKLTSYRALRAELVRKMLSSHASAVYVSALALRQRPRVDAVTVDPGGHADSRTSLPRLVTTFIKTVFYYGPVGRLIPQAKVTTLLPIAEIQGARS